MNVQESSAGFRFPRDNNRQRQQMSSDSPNLTSHLASYNRRDLTDPNVRASPPNSRGLSYGRTENGNYERRNDGANSGSCCSHEDDAHLTSLARQRIGQAPTELQPRNQTISYDRGRATSRQAEPLSSRNTTGIAVDHVVDTTNSLQRFADPNRVQVSGDRFAQRRMSDQIVISPNENNKIDSVLFDKYGSKDDDLVAAGLAVTGGSGYANVGLQQSCLYRSRPLQDIASLDQGNQGLDVQSGVFSHDRLAERKPSGYTRDVSDQVSTKGRYNVISGSDEPPVSRNCVQGDIKTNFVGRGLQSDNMSCFDTTPRRSVNTPVSFEGIQDQSQDMGSTRRSGIPVSTHRRSASSCRDSSVERRLDAFSSCYTPRTSAVNSIRDNQSERSYGSAQTYPERTVCQGAPKQRNLSVGSESTPVSRPRSAAAQSSAARESRQIYPTSSTPSGQPTGRATVTTPVSRLSVRTPSTSNYGIGDRSRSQLPKKASQSQPGSRSTSPASRFDYITYTRPVDARSSRPSSTSSGYTRSRIPRSQGHSRDTSPSRSSQDASSRPVVRRTGAGALAFQQLQNGVEMESAFTDALLARSRGGFEISRRDDGVFSETSSVSSASENYNRLLSAPTMDVPEIIAHLSSGSWSERRDGLMSLKAFLKFGLELSATDVKKVSELFTRMFHDPNAKVFAVYLETLPTFVKVHAADVTNDWLYLSLSRMLGKFGGELLTSVLGRLNKALAAFRNEFRVNDQLNALSQFVCNSPKLNDAKVRVAFLEYLHELALSMDSSELNNSTSVQQLIIRIVSWTSEPKCTSIRVLSQSVVIALFNTNTPEFYSILSALPRSLRDAGYEILQSHVSAVSRGLNTVQPPVRSQPAQSVRQSSVKTQDDTDSNSDRMSTEEFYASFKKAAEDIQSLNRMDYY